MYTERPADLKSEYFFRALRFTKEQTAGDPQTEHKAQLLETIIKEVHTQAAHNLTRWESKTNPGVSEIVTRISVLDLVKKLGVTGISADKLDKQPDRIREDILLSSMPNELPIFFKADGSTHTAFDIALDNAIRAIPQVVASLKDPNRPVEDITILCTSNPCALGGTLTPEWAAKVKDQGSYVTFAQHHAEQVMGELQDPRVLVRLIGHSFGGTSAVQTAIQLEKQGVTDRVTVLADSAVLGHEPQKPATSKKVKDQGKTVVQGAVKAAFKAVWDRREDFAAKLWIGHAYKKQLMANGVEAKATPEQKHLRHEVLQRVGADLSVILDQLYPTTIKTYVRLGAYDETLPDPHREQHYQDLQKTHQGWVPPVLEHPQPNVRVFGTNNAHAVERIRTDHWLRAVEALD